MSTQMTFDWPVGVSLGAEDFFVSDANAQAYAMVQTPATWPERKLVIVGPAGAGKTHLARIFAGDTGVVIASDAVPDMPPATGIVVVEDMHALPPDAIERMFHLHNHLRNTGSTLLMTAQTPPSRWPIALPDLASRMQATTAITISDPDDALLAALIMKLFADRQMRPAPALIAYLSRRIERSFFAAHDIVEMLDEVSLREGVPITRALAARLLDKDG